MIPGCGSDGVLDPARADAAYLDLRVRLDPAFPGRGIADYPGFPVADVPKAYAMIMLAEITKRAKNPVHDLDLAAVSGRWLIQHADEDEDGVPGWGVPVAWDAYGDRSVNPVNTEYSISTGIVVRALLDWLDADPLAPREAIEEQVSAALSRWASPDLRSPAGLLPYSLVVADRRYDTFNPAAYLAGQMQRYSQKAKPELAERLRAAADATMSALLRHKLDDPNGDWYWQYSVQEAVPNDMAHAVYIMEGVRAYVTHGGKLGERFDLSRISGHLRAFLREDDAFVSAWPVFHKAINRPTRSYDIGMGLWYAARDSQLAAVTPRLARHLPSYRRDDGLYRKYPRAGDLKDGDDLAVGEYQAYILAGLAAWSASGP